MIQINESVSVKSRDNTPINSGVYLYYNSITILKDIGNDSWILNIRLYIFESLSYAQKINFNVSNSVELPDDKVKTRYKYSVTNQEAENNSILKLADDNIKIDLDKIFTPSNVIIVS